MFATEKLKNCNFGGCTKRLCSDSGNQYSYCDRHADMECVINKTKLKTRICDLTLILVYTNK